jgi:hypothetical protein
VRNHAHIYDWREETRVSKKRTFVT